jgi:hypothetical protein
MIWKTKKSDIGRSVVRMNKDVLPHADGSIDTVNCSFGTVQDFNEDYIFVIYQGQTAAKAEFAQNLEWTDDFNITAGRINKKELRHGSKTNKEGEAKTSQTA